MALINDEQTQSVEETQPEARPRGAGRGRRTLVVAMGVLVATVVMITLGLTLARGSGWHMYFGDLPLDADSRARVEAIREEVEASGKAPDAVRWLDAALASGTDATAVRLHLINAQEALEATGDADLAEAAQELRAIIQEIRPGP
jgi:hypothetical protein